MDEYKYGYIGVIDILGFGQFSFNEANFNLIKSTMNDLFAIKKTYEYNFGEKICIMSDTIVILVEIEDEQKYDQAYFDSIVEWIGLFKIIIKRRLGLFSRAALTIGSFYYDEEKNILFGPGIVRGVMLTEKIDKIPEIDSLDHHLKCRPACFIIDNLFFRINNIKVQQLLFENMTVNSIKSKKEFIHVGEDYYIYNYFFSEYNYLLLGKNDASFFDNYYQEAQETIAKQESNGQFYDKYYFERKCLGLLYLAHCAKN